MTKHKNSVIISQPVQLCGFVFLKLNQKIYLMSPRTIAKSIIMIQFEATKLLSKKYKLFLMLRIASIIPLIIGIILLINKIQMIGWLFFIASFICYALPSIVKAIVKNARDKTKKALSDAERFSELYQKAKDNPNVEETIEYLKEMKSIKKNDKDYRLGKIIYYAILLFFLCLFSFVTYLTLSFLLLFFQ